MQEAVDQLRGGVETQHLLRRTCRSGEINRQWDWDNIGWSTRRGVSGGIGGSICRGESRNVRRSVGRSVSGGSGWGGCWGVRGGGGPGWGGCRGVRGGGSPGWGGRPGVCWRISWCIRWGIRSCAGWRDRSRTCRRNEW